MARLVFLALLAQLLSGGAAIVNQIVWQRSLIVYLAGSEAVSSMIVVFAFMLGLGAGALWVGGSAHRVENPARSLALVEMLLGAANVIVLVALSTDPIRVLSQLQSVALSLGASPRVGYAIVSGVTLLGPCFLMGVTSPLMSEVAQRQLGLRDSRFVVVIFFANTLGAFVGGLTTGFLLMPLVGQRVSLVIAVAFNLVTALLLLRLSRGCASTVTEVPRPALQPGLASAWPGSADRLGFALGFLALAYEMYLYRILALAFEPKPFTFASVLCLYLLLWSIGVLVARWIRWRLAITLVLTSLAITPIDTLSSALWTSRLDTRSALLALGFWLPCLGFGAAFGQLVMRVAVRWGNDVGRLYGWNTVGSCLGILTGVLVGYEYNPTFTSIAVGVGYLTLAVATSASATPRHHRVGWLTAALAVGAGLWVANVGVLFVDHAHEPARGTRLYFSCEGVVEVRSDRAMFWNGLGHGRLARDADYLDEGDWRQAVIPLLAHGATGEKDVLVVGLGTGITVGTLARSSLVRTVRVYEINPALKGLLSDYPEGTLNVGTRPNVEISWRDGRTGLALSDRRYDIVTQAPLYLKQAGSSMLLSREYLELVRSRMKPSGVYAIYSNAQGHRGPLLIVRRTAREVFRFCQSFCGGYLTLASDSPFEYDVESLTRVLAAARPGDRVKEEIDDVGLDRVAAYRDPPPTDWGEDAPVLTDDRPIVEYPDLADRLVARRRAGRARRLEGAPAR